MQDYLKSLNPKIDEHAILIYDANYKLWRDGEFLGIATWRKDENVGDSFQTHGEKDENGFYKVNVFIADKWELQINNK